MEEVSVPQIREENVAYKINHFNGEGVLNRRRSKTAPFETELVNVDSSIT